MRKEQVHRLRALLRAASLLAALALGAGCGDEDVAPSTDAGAADSGSVTRDGGSLDGAPRADGATATDAGPMAGDAGVAMSDAEATTGDAGVVTLPDAASCAATRAFGEACTDACECASALCFTFGDGTSACTQTCSSGAECPVGSMGQRCNLMGVCRP